MYQMYGMQYFLHSREVQEILNSHCHQEQHIARNYNERVKMEHLCPYIYLFILKSALSCKSFHNIDIKMPVYIEMSFEVRFELQSSLFYQPNAHS